MKIDSKNNYMPHFKGYDARNLSGVFVTDPECAKELKRISKDCGFDVFTPTIASKSIKKECAELVKGNKLLWAQDYMTVISDKAVIFDNSRDFLKRVLRASSDGLMKTHKLQPVKVDTHIRGGNFFICDNVDGKKKLLINENKMLYDDKLLKLVYGVDEVCPIPKLDYHLDLFIRPLTDGKVLVADENMTKEGLEKGIIKLQEYIKTHPEDKEQIEQVIEQIGLQLEKFEITQEFAPYKAPEILPKVVQALENYGFTPIRVPGTYYYLKPIKNEDKAKECVENFNNNLAYMKNFAEGQSPEFQREVGRYINTMLLKFDLEKDKLGLEPQNVYDNNFINAIVSKNSDGELDYITNASLLDKEMGITPEIEEKTGFSTKNMFLESVSPYIDKENVHFISEKLTERLFKFFGGVHCTAVEMVKP